MYVVKCTPPTARGRWQVLFVIECLDFWRVFGSKAGCGCCERVCRGLSWDVGCRMLLRLVERF